MSVVGSHVVCRPTSPAGVEFAFGVALVESDLPGGHSPGYFAALNQPLPTSRLVWRNDPAAFSGFPDFFIAHELAHQWWGQAVGWKNYHEQWVSEGFAQYFAALYAQREKGNDEFETILKQQFGHHNAKNEARTKLETMKQ